MNETARKWLAGELVGGAKLCSSSSKETIFNLDSSVRYGGFFYFKIFFWLVQIWFKLCDIHTLLHW